MTPCPPKKVGGWNRRSTRENGTARRAENGSVGPRPAARPPAARRAGEAEGPVGALAGESEKAHSSRGPSRDGPLSKRTLSSLFRGSLSFDGPSERARTRRPGPGLEGGGVSGETPVLPAPGLEGLKGSRARSLKSRGTAVDRGRQAHVQEGRCPSKAAVSRGPQRSRARSRGPLVAGFPSPSPAPLAQTRHVASISAF
jgi:hypothetical protein